MILEIGQKKGEKEENQSQKGEDYTKYNVINSWLVGSS